MYVPYMYDCILYRHRIDTANDSDLSVPRPAYGKSKFAWIQMKVWL